MRYSHLSGNDKEIYRKFFKDLKEMKFIESKMEEMANMPKEEFGKRQPGELNTYEWSNSGLTKEEYKKKYKIFPYNS